MSPDLPIEPGSVHERIELAEVTPLVEQHRHLALVYPGRRARVAAWPAEAAVVPSA